MSQLPSAAGRLPENGDASLFPKNGNREASLKILVVGISVRALVESAVRAHYAVTALDAFGDQDLRAQAQTYSLRRDFGVPYSPRALYEAGRPLGCEAVAYTSNLENHPEILDLFAAGHRIIGNSPQVVRSVRDWPVLFSRLERAGFPVPETIHAGRDHNSDRDRPWLVKPVLSGGGHGISFSHGKEFAGKHWMLQRYIPGKSCSASFVSDGRETVVVGITEQLTGMRQFGVQDFRYCGSILPLRETLEPGIGETILEQVRRLSAFLTREFGLLGVNGFDFILEGDQVHLIEVNPRYTASMELIERAYGLAIFHLHMQAVMDKRLPSFRLESLLHGKKFFGKSILFSGKDVIVPEALNWRQWDVGDIPAHGEKLRVGSPICTFFAWRATYDDTLAELIRRAEMLKEQIHGQA
jgi:uncharacterized protein